MCVCACACAHICCDPLPGVREASGEGDLRTLTFHLKGFSHSARGYIFLSVWKLNTQDYTVF